MIDETCMMLKYGINVMQSCDTILFVVLDFLVSPTLGRGGGGNWGQIKYRLGRETGTTQLFLYSKVKNSEARIIGQCSLKIKGCLSIWAF